MSAQFFPRVTQGGTYELSRTGEAFKPHIDRMDKAFTASCIEKLKKGQTIALKFEDRILRHVATLPMEQREICVLNGIPNDATIEVHVDPYLVREKAIEFFKNTLYGRVEVNPICYVDEYYFRERETVHGLSMKLVKDAPDQKSKQ